MARIFITGSTDGLGLESARQLVQRGQPSTSTPVTRSQVNAIGDFDVIIHNAGLLHGPFRKTADTGRPTMIAANALAPYILTALINRPKRLIFIASTLHTCADTSIKDIFCWRCRYPDKLKDGVEAYIMLAEGDYDQSLTGVYFELKRRLGKPLPETGNVDLQDKVVEACEKVVGLKLPA
ncbi:Rhamnogalacturonase A [Fusarium oxysporum f. sp. albedinis]|nr:Rhamnogalacturonase A [Fusarium oxysporum f. sp. albedinis]